MQTFWIKNENINHLPWPCFLFYNFLSQAKFIFENIELQKLKKVNFNFFNEKKTAQQKPAPSKLNYYFRETKLICSTCSTVLKSVLCITFSGRTCLNDAPFYWKSIDLARNKTGKLI